MNLSLFSWFFDDRGLGKELEILIPKNTGLDVDKKLHPRLLTLTE
jgi:hypothetical protein